MEENKENMFKTPNDLKVKSITILDSQRENRLSQPEVT